MAVVSNARWGALQFVVSNEHYSGDRIQKNRMRGTCSTYREKEKCMQALMKNLKERDYVVVIGVDGWIIIKWNSTELDRKFWTQFVWLRIWKVGGLLWRWLRDFREAMRNHQLLNTDSEWCNTSVSAVPVSWGNFQQFILVFSEQMYIFN